MTNAPTRNTGRVTRMGRPEAGELLYHGPWVTEHLAELDGFLAEHPDDVAPITRQVIEGGRKFDAMATLRAWHRPKELQRRSRPATTQGRHPLDLVALTVPFIA